jgi:hypothetical protein
VELRLVVTFAAVLRALAATGTDWLLPVYSSLADALANGACAAGLAGNQPEAG